MTQFGVVGAGTMGAGIARVCAIILSSRFVCRATWVYWVTRFLSERALPT